MNFCYSLLAFFGVALTLIYIFKKPSKSEIKKFENKNQDKVNWSRMGF
tara:strand:+ start:43 stop:186 length:144 start_codon:yes stop_codon:yes gene_type:complete